MSEMQEKTGTKYCKNCQHFYDGGRGMFCLFPKFVDQYTETCPKFEENPKR